MQSDVPMSGRTTRQEDVRRAVLAEIVDGSLPPGSKLPNEDALAERYNVSRATVREALRSLITASHLTRRHGHGTFVSSTPVSRHALDTTVSYTAMIRRAGFEPSERVLSKVLRAATEEEVERLGIESIASVVVVERVRLADGRPVIASLDRIPVALLPGDALDRLDASLYVLLEWAGAQVRFATARLVPVLATTRLAKLLEVARNSPLLHIEEVDVAADGQPVMLSSEWHVPDAFELVVNRRAQDDAGR
jgi:GntR family transcriptional regulator